MLVFEYNGAIFVELMKSASADQYAKAYTKATDHYHITATVQHKFHLDNFVLATLKESIKVKERSCHRTRAYSQPPCPTSRERAIATWKDHFVATLAGADPDYPVDTQWNKAKNHAMLTLILLTPWHPNPTINCYTALKGHNYDWNRYPLAPFGCRTLGFETKS